MERRHQGMLIVVLSAFLTLAAFFAAAALREKEAPALQGAKVAVVYITGPLGFSQGGVSAGAEQVLKQLEKAAADAAVRAVVLRINSPGGSAAASQEIYRQVLKLKAAGKKIVASFGDIAASGGYYVAVAADKIVANPATITGSIGVIATVPNLEELYAKIGYREQVFKSGPHKDMLSPGRPVTPEERRIISRIVAETYDDFMRAVARGRNMPLERVRELADGRIYTGAQAKELGLVDALGGLEDALDLAARLAGIRGKPRVVTYRSLTLSDLLNLAPGGSLLPRTPPGYTTLNF